MFRKSYSRNGFTLVELVLMIPVLLIIGAFIGTAVWDTIYNFRLNAATAQVLHDIRYAQQQAVSRGSWYGVLFENDPTNRYSVYQTDGTTDTNLTDPVTKTEPMVIDVSDSYSVTISAVNIGGGTQIEFNPMGVPYLDKNGAALAVSATITLTGGTQSETILIYPTTGRVELQ